jgi:hypothetical protein
MGKVGPFVRDPKAGASCQITLDNGDRIVVSHDKADFKGGRVSVEKTKWMGMASDPVGHCELDSPEGKRALAHLTEGAPPGSARATPLGAFVDFVKDCPSAAEVRMKLWALLSSPE